ncbi:MAG: hypothetical protein IT289_03760 [Oligoflexia bacterium]|nr:hypothetical protein [Oligoflexia bacterium]
MLRFESIFWASSNPTNLKSRLESLGFEFGPSRRDPLSEAVYFGPESLEILSSKEQKILGGEINPSQQPLNGDGILGLTLESDHIGEDYQRLKELSITGTPRSAQSSDLSVPLWYGFGLNQFVEGLSAWVVQNSPKELARLAQENLPNQHPNSCFGIEGIHLAHSSPQEAIKKVAKIIDRVDSGYTHHELVKTQGRRVQSGDRYIDAIALNHELISEITKNHAGIYMLTLRVVDLEKAKDMAVKAGAKITPCHNRDGFIVPSGFTGGPALRFVRHFWKRYLPTVPEYYPKGRRSDVFRPLGGAYSSSLTKGFEDDWSF